MGQNMQITNIEVANNDTTWFMASSEELFLDNILFENNAFSLPFLIATPHQSYFNINNINFIKNRGLFSLAFIGSGRITESVIERNSFYMPIIARSENLTFNNICSVCPCNGDVDIAGFDYSCEEVCSYINLELCDESLNSYNTIDGNKYYIPNYYDPNGDDFQKPNEDCCIIGDTSCSIQDTSIKCMQLRDGIDCDAIACNDIIECTSYDQLGDYYNSISQVIGLNNSVIDEDDFTYLGTEGNFQYDCYYNNHQSNHYRNNQQQK